MPAMSLAVPRSLKIGGLVAFEPDQAGHDRSFRFVGAAAVDQSFFTGGAAAAIKSAGQRHARQAAAGHSGDRGGSRIEGTFDGAALAEAARAQWQRQIRGRRILVAIQDPDRFGGINHARHTDLGLAIQVVIDVLLRRLGGGIDVHSDQGILIFAFIGRIGLDGYVGGGEFQLGLCVGTLRQKEQDADHSTIENHGGQDSHSH